MVPHLRWTSLPFDVETEKFIDVLQPIELSTKQTNNVTRIYSLEKGIAWILCESGYAFRVDEQLCKKEKASHFIQLPTTT